MTPTAAQSPDPGTSSRASSAASTHGASTFSHKAHHVAQSVSHTAQRVADHLRDLRQQRLFVYLTTLAVLMVIINIIQVILIDRIHSIVWVTVFPGAVLILSLMAIMLSGLLSRRNLATAWRDATIQRRTAWLGVTASILLPILVCQFLYMPLVAVPTWRTAQWTTSIGPLQAANWPAVIVSVNSVRPSPDAGWVGTTHLMSAPHHPVCFIQNPRNMRTQACILSRVAYPKLAMLNAGYQSYTFDPLVTENALALSSVGTAFEAELGLRFPFTFNISSPPPLSNGSKSSLQLARTIGFYQTFDMLRASLYDPKLSFNQYAEYSAAYYHPEGPSNLISSAPITLTDSTDVQLTVQGARVFDKAEVLPGRTALVAQYQHGQPATDIWDYTYYDTQINNDNSGMKLNENSFCNVASPGFAGYHNPCWLEMTVRMRSPLFSTQTSSHGTTPLKILIDEGSILGAIFFFTWFASIFVV